TAAMTATATATGMTATATASATMTATRVPTASPTPTKVLQPPSPSPSPSTGITATAPVAHHGGGCALDPQSRSAGGALALLVLLVCALASRRHTTGVSRVARRCGRLSRPV